MPEYGAHPIPVGERLLSCLAPFDRNDDGGDETEKHRAKQDAGTQDVTDFHLGGFGGRRRFARGDGESDESLLRVREVSFFIQGPRTALFR